MIKSRNHPKTLASVILSEAKNRFPRRRLPGLAALACAALALGPHAHAFFPFGGSPVDQFELRFLRWAFEDIDSNSDGDVSGQDGIDITLESGEFGWTDEEMLVLEDAFDVWENVPSSYMAFRFTLPLEDPAGFGLPTETTLFLDGINLIAVQTEDDPFQDPNVAAPGVLGITFPQFVIDDGFFETVDGRITFPVTGGRILEADIVFDAAEIRALEVGTDPNASLFGVAVHEIGHFIGLGHNPMNNLETTPDGNLVESPVFALRDADGELQNVGVTPTMFPFLFEVDDGTGDLDDGAGDLAVDDIAGATFLYPRISGDDSFFMIANEARNQVRPGVPSIPLLGGLVTAWVENDDEPATPRVPLVSTMTGLYEYRTDVQDRGRFELRGLPKIIETIGSGVPIEATYTLTLEPLNGLRLPNQGPENFDSTHILPGNNEWEGVEYDTGFQSEVFHRDGGFFGRDNFDAGTAVMWDEGRGRVVLAATGETLESVLEFDEPMFGDESDICPLLIIEEAAGVTLGPSMLRRFRDDWLLPTAVGAAFVDVYYQTAPTMANVVMTHRILKTVLVKAAIGVEWGLRHPHPVGFAALVFAGMAGALRVARRRRLVRAGAAAIVFGVATLGIAQQSGAALRYLTDEEKTELSDAIVQGTVTMVQSREVNNGQAATILTDTVIEVDDGMKGDLDSSATVTLTIPGGRVGNRLTHVSELPRFAQGEEVLLYLYFVEGHGYVVTGGIQGKVRIFTNADTGQKYVQNSSFPEHKAAAEAKRAQGDPEPTRVPLDDYKAAIEEVVKRERDAR